MLVLRAMRTQLPRARGLNTSTPLAVTNVFLQPQLRFFSASAPATAGSAAPAAQTGSAGQGQSSQIIFHSGTHGGQNTPQAKAMETYEQFAMRWLDVGGGLTRMYSRRAWIMDYDPQQRAELLLFTEYERWLCNFMGWATFLCVPIAMWYFFGEWAHLACKPPTPQTFQGSGMAHFSRDLDFFPWDDVVTVSQCKRCRFMEYECKKMCYDRLREMGHPIYGCDIPRTQSFGFH